MNSQIGTSPMLVIIALSIYVTIVQALRLSVRYAKPQRTGYRRLYSTLEERKLELLPSSMRPAFDVGPVETGKSNSKAASPAKPRLHPVYFHDGAVFFHPGEYQHDNGMRLLLEGLDEGTTAESDSSGGIFLTFDFLTTSSQHDAVVGRIPYGSRILTHSRIKRWWMAPNFMNSVDDVPVETQLMLLEIDPSLPFEASADTGAAASATPSNHFYSNSPARSLHIAKQGVANELRKLKIPFLAPEAPESTFLKSKGKKYAVIAPLIDFDRGFRVTLYGGKEGGAPAGRGLLAARLESGDPTVRTDRVENAMYIAAGDDPYQLLETAYDSISKKMGTFRTREEKIKPPGIDSFGFCTWDAFYSSVDSDKVESALKSLHDVGVTPKFVILDDGWQSTSLTGKHREHQHAKADGELSGAQIDGNVASESLVNSAGSPLIRMATRAITDFYTNHVEKAEPDAWSVKLWSAMSHTILKDKLIDFFAMQTDFSKVLTSWKANSKFEDEATGKSLKGFVQTLKGKMGVDYVFVWHALSGYWGGISEDTQDDLPNALNDETSSVGSDMLFEPDLDEITNLHDIASGKSLHPSLSPDTVMKSGRLSHPVQKSLGDGLLKLSTKILSLAKIDISGPPVKRAYANPTPHLLLIEPALAWDPSSLVGVGSVAVNKLERMYKKMHAYLADAGVDGVKVDAQSGIGAFGRGNGGGSAIAHACVRAVENSVKTAFGPKTKLGKDMKQQISTLSAIGRRIRAGFARLTFAKKVNIVQETPVALVGCMCHSTENLLNYFETSMARASDDFYPRDAAAQTVHLVSCAYNSVMLGEIATTDWDMFHSKHPCAAMHAAARAVSGGPVYVSDAPGNHDPVLLRRLVLPDGGILRAQLPARPTRDTLFADVMRDGTTAMKVWSMNKVGAVAGVFNVQGSSWDRKQRRYVSHALLPPQVTAELRPSDIGGDFAAVVEEEEEEDDDVRDDEVFVNTVGTGTPTAATGMTSNTDNSPSASASSPTGTTASSKTDTASVPAGTAPATGTPITSVPAVVPHRPLMSRFRMPLRKIIVRLPFFGKRSTKKGREEEHNSNNSNKKKHVHSHHPVDMFVAWSAADRKLTVVEGRDASLKFDLKPKDWDVISLSHVYDVKTARPRFANVVGALGRVMRLRKNDFVGVTANSKTDKSGVTTLTVEPNPVVSAPTSTLISVPPTPISFASTPVSEPGNESAPVESTYDGTIITPAAATTDANKPVFWSPIGLLNMLNAGGAVEQILSTRKARTAEFLAKGPGEFGVFASSEPKRILVDGVQVTFATELVTTAVTELGTLTLPEVASLVKFNLTDYNSVGGDSNSEPNASDLSDLHSRGIRKIVITW